eukprot:2287794-Pleurochrysis_carterae.AAC.3
MRRIGLAASEAGVAAVHVSSLLKSQPRTLGRLRSGSDNGGGERSGGGGGRGNGGGGSGGGGGGGFLGRQAVAGTAACVQPRYATAPCELVEMAFCRLAALCGKTAIAPLQTGWASMATVQTLPSAPLAMAAGAGELPTHVATRFHIQRFCEIVVSSRQERIRGSQGADGRITVSFGTLFRAQCCTMQSAPAIVHITQKTSSKLIAGLTEAQLDQTVEAFLRAECQQRAEQLKRHVDSVIEKFEGEAKRAKKVLQEALTKQCAVDDDAADATAADDDGAAPLCEPFAFVAIRGLHQGKIFKLEPTEAQKAWTVGRSAECDISLAGDDEVSSRHAKVIYEKKAFKLSDDDSTNGTFATNTNGKTIKRPTSSPSAAPLSGGVSSQKRRRRSRRPESSVADPRAVTAAAVRERRRHGGIARGSTDAEAWSSACVCARGAGGVVMAACTGAVLLIMRTQSLACSASHEPNAPLLLAPCARVCNPSLEA